MPLHDWTRVPSGLYHDFHQAWTHELRVALNAGPLPKGYTALVEQRAGRREPDVLAVETRRRPARRTSSSRSGTMALERPQTRFAYRSNRQIYAGKANRVVVKHHLGRTVAMIELLSPGNKDSRAAVRDFVDKTVEFLRAGVHVLLIDPFPPTPRDPQGMHKLVWDEISEAPFSFPAGHDRLLAAYEAAPELSAYVETLGVGDCFPNMPLFLDDGVYVQTPLEAAYRAAWDDSPEELRTAVETGVLPSFEDDDGDE